MTPVERWNDIAGGPLSEAAMTRKLTDRGYAADRSVYPPGARFPEHTHGVDKIDAVLAGGFRMTVAGREVILRARDCLAVPRRTIHRAEVVGNQPVVSLDAVKT